MSTRDRTCADHGALLSWDITRNRRCRRWRFQCNRFQEFFPDILTRLWDQALLGRRAASQSFHSLGHTFTDALRRAGATGEVIDGMLGWSRGNMRDRYGNGPWTKMLAEVMQKVEYPRLELGRLYVR